MKLSDAIREHELDCAGLEIERTAEKATNLLKWLDKIDELEDERKIAATRVLAEAYQVGRRPTVAQILEFKAAFPEKFAN